MAYKESNFQTDFLRWGKVVFRGTMAFELKVSRGNSVPFSSFYPHQRASLSNVKHNCVGYKIPDDGFSQKPMDGFFMSHQPAFIGIMFHAKRPGFYLIDIDAILEEIKTSSRKSLTEERAKEIGTYYDLAGKIPFQNKGINNPQNAIDQPL